MKARPYFPLLAKVLGWLFLHLLVLGLVGFGFMGWQLGLGLDSLLSGSAGDRLRSFGDSVRGEIISLPESKWNEEIAALAQEKKVVAAIVEPGEWTVFPKKVPPNVVERLKTAVPPQPGPPDRRRPPGMGRRGPRNGDFGGPEDGPPPDDLGPPDDFGPRPHEDPERGFGGLGPGERPPRPGFNANPGKLQPPLTRPVFLVRGEGGDGYWAGVHLMFQGISNQPPRPRLLLIRADGLDGSGMFFEFKPWLWGGLAVLGFSLAFWAPFVWSLTRYIGRLTAATDRIAAGQFKITIPPRGNDELGNLGHAIETMAGRLDLLVGGQKRFLGDAAHELCAPLARLRTGLGILEMKLGEGDQPHLEAIETDAQELATLVEEILAFSRAGNRQPRTREIALEPLIDEVVIRERTAKSPRVVIPSGLTVLGDPSLLGRAIGNLLRNAQVHAGPEASVSIEAGVHGPFTEITVSDDGPGVPAEELPRLFEPFYRPDRSRSRETGGSGLGLAIVRTAVEACGGEVSAALSPEGGLAVTLRLRGATA